jgi:hypothetical protein
VDALNPHPLPPSKTGALKLESLLPIAICCNEDKRTGTRRHRLGIAWNESEDPALKYREKPMAEALGLPRFELFEYAQLLCPSIVRPYSAIQSTFSQIAGFQCKRSAFETITRAERPSDM